MAKGMQGGTNMVWTSDTITPKLPLFDIKVAAAVTAVLGLSAARMEAYAKTNAPWKDRSTDARNGLHATVQAAPPVWRIILAHAVPYGIWLEVRWAGRYAIIAPTLQHEGPQLMASIGGAIATAMKTGA
jgi:hypothetical protein